eukprot:UN00794
MFFQPRKAPTTLKLKKYNLLIIYAVFLFRFFSRVHF